MLTLLFIFLGLVFGGMLGGAGGALFGGVAGYVLSAQIGLASRLENLEGQVLLLSAQLKKQRSAATATAPAFEPEASAGQDWRADADQDASQQSTNQQASPVFDLDLPAEASNPQGVPQAAGEYAMPEESLPASLEPPPVAIPEYWNEPTPAASFTLEPVALKPVISEPLEPAPAEPAYAAEAVRPARKKVSAPEPAFDLFALIRNYFTGGNPVARIGIVILFFGVGFLLKYAAEHTHVPIELRFIGVAAGALALLALGWRLRESKPAYAMALQGGAIGVLYLTSYASVYFDVLGSGQVFYLLILVAVFAGILAVMQDALALAFLGATGGFLAPVLASSGGGNHVALFSYYALLNAGIFGIAWFKAWRPLNLLGFVFTFAVGVSWGVLRYSPELLASTEPFLILFFLFYVAIAVLYAHRQAPQLRHYVDGTLIFGTPVLAFGIQTALVRHIPYALAYSALAAGALYLLLARGLYGRRREELRLLVEAFLALGIAFATLAIPLAFDGIGTSAAWALEGAALLWVGVRQERQLARISGLLLQFAAGIALFGDLQPAAAAFPAGALPVLNSRFFTMTLVAVAGLFCARTLYRYRDQLPEPEAGSDGLFFAWGLAWWFGAGFVEMHSHLATSPLLRWSALLWALQGAAILWLGLRHRYAPANAAGILLQLVAGLLLLLDLQSVPDSMAAPVFNSRFLATLAVSLGGFLCAYFLLLQARRKEAAQNGQEAAFGDAALFYWGLAWWLGAGFIEMHSHLATSPLLRWSALLWALEGMAILWLGLRYRYAPASAVGVLLQFAAGLMLLPGLQAAILPALLVPDPATVPVFNSRFLAILAVSLGGFLCAFFLFLQARRKETTNKRRELAFDDERIGNAVLFYWGLAWWLVAGLSEIRLHASMQYLFTQGLLFLAVTAWLCGMLTRRLKWKAPRPAALALLPCMLLSAPVFMATQAHPFAHGGYIVWPLVFAAFYHILWLLEKRAREFVLTTQHILAFWLLAALLGWEFAWRIDAWVAGAGSWPLIGWAVVPALLLAALPRLCRLLPWPVGAYKRAYLGDGGAGLALFLFAWTLFANFTSNGNPYPLPYVPLLNPLDLAQIFVFLALVGWLRHARALLDAPPADATRIAIRAAFAAALFVWLNAVLLRTLHFWAGVPFAIEAMIPSALVQASLSVFWTLLAMAAMVWGARRVSRPFWLAGAGLMVAVVVKLFLVDLSNSGTVERIVSFMGVGLLMLVIGYFAPLPPAAVQEEQPA